MSLTLAGVVLGVIAVIALAMLREAAIHGLGLPGLEQHEWQLRARERSAAERNHGRKRRPVTGPAVKAAGRAAGIGLVGGVLAATVGAAGGVLAVLAVIAWYTIG